MSFACIKSVACRFDVISQSTPFTAMDNLSSADLDTSSKTPLFIGIAAIIVGLTGAAIGWLGFSKANELEQQLAKMASDADSVAEVGKTVDSNGEMIRRMAGKMTSIEKGLADIKGGVEADMVSVKQNLRKVAMDAGTALKKAEALEKSGVRVATSSPAPTSSSASTSTSSKSTGETATASGEAGTHKIESGDTYERLRVRYNLKSVNELIDANPGVDPRRLMIGQSIVIPAAKE